MTPDLFDTVSRAIDLAIDEHGTAATATATATASDGARPPTADRPH